MNYDPAQGCPARASNRRRVKASETLRAPAKLNLTLEVLQRRDDGLHALRSVMVPLDLCDGLRVEPSLQRTFSCNVPELLRDNLVAIAQLAESLDQGSFELAMQIVPLDWWVTQLPDRPSTAGKLPT